jgi:hypothetical protein
MILNILVVILIICLILLIILCVFHMTEYMIYKLIWGKRNKVLPAKDCNKEITINIPVNNV